MPGIFKVDATYNSASSRATHDQQITIFAQASRIARKAEIVFIRDKMSLAADMVTEIEKALVPERIRSRLSNSSRYLTNMVILCR